MPVTRSLVTGATGCVGGRLVPQLVDAGLLGHLYWWSIYPFHGIIFASMQKNIANAAEALQEG